jgi:hypothetical protein
VAGHNQRGASDPKRSSSPPSKRAKAFILAAVAKGNQSRRVPSSMKPSMQNLITGHFPQSGIVVSHGPESPCQSGQYGLKSLLSLSRPYLRSPDSTHGIKKCRQDEVQPPSWQDRSFIQGICIGDGEADPPRASYHEALAPDDTGKGKFTNGKKKKKAANTKRAPRL